MRCKFGRATAEISPSETRILYLVDYIRFCGAPEPSNLSKPTRQRAKKRAVAERTEVLVHPRKRDWGVGVYQDGSVGTIQ